jgi:hypothetical protein
MSKTRSVSGVDYLASLEMTMGLQFDDEEEAAGELLLDFMQTVKDWGLDCNWNEFTSAIHTLQMFVFQHALQRTGGINGEWYESLRQEETS